MLRLGSILVLLLAASVVPAGPEPDFAGTTRLHRQPWRPQTRPADVYNLLIGEPVVRCPQLNITRIKGVRVTACSPDDPKDRAYYAANGYEGNVYGVAADLRVLPRGSLIRVPGYLSGAWVYVDSAGGSVIRRSTRSGSTHIDVKYRTLHSAKQWGSQVLEVEVIYPSDFNETSSQLKVRK